MQYCASDAQTLTLLAVQGVPRAQRGLVLLQHGLDLPRRDPAVRAEHLQDKRLVSATARDFLPPSSSERTCAAAAARCCSLDAAAALDPALETVASRRVALWSARLAACARACWRSCCCSGDGWKTGSAVGAGAGEDA
jgi:hypothetical protein